MSDQTRTINNNNVLDYFHKLAEMEDDLSLDSEFKRYLQILRPYLAQLTNDDVISICNAWIRRLSDCNEQDKNLRNKYVFTLCYQLAKGNLEDPFLKLPPNGNLLPLNESVDGDDSSTEIECMVVNADDRTTNVLFNKQTPLSDTEYLSQGNEYENTTDSQFGIEANRTTISSTSKPSRQQTVLCYTCPEMLMNYSKFSTDVYEDRAKNLINKLREIKNENFLLHNELIALKVESNSKSDYTEDEIVKVDHSTSAYVKQNESNTTLKSLKFKLQEVQESRNNLIDKIAALQEQIDNFTEMKKNDIEDIEAKHKLEIINMKSAIKEEVKDMYERKLEEIKTDYDTTIKDLQKQLQDLKIEKDTVTENKNKIISSKEIEIKQLKSQIDDLKSHLHSVLENFVSNPSTNTGDTLKFKAEQLEKRLNKMEKNKIKSTRVFEAKLAQMQREKHLAECSLQLQMVRQRAQVVNEVTDENQAELSTALDKLETKYKEIVANVQATAIQRRMQDQISLESILQAACGIPAENINSQGTNQFSKTIRSNQNRSYDNEISTLLHCNKVNNAGGNKSFGDDSLVTGYCLNGERMGELFERVYIPQRDNQESK